MKTQVEKEMSFLEHLEELRRRIIVTLLFALILSVISYVFSDRVTGYLLKPVGKLYFFSPEEGFFVRLKVSLFLGLFLAMPIGIYELWLFIKPALKPNEGRMLLPILIFSVLLFYTGGLFAVFLLVPLGVRVLIELGGKSFEALINASKYLNFVLFFTLVMALIFEAPLLTFGLTKAGILDPQSLRRRRREVIVGIFIVVAILTPSVDFLTLLLVALPLVLLFEVSLLVARK